MIDLVGILEVLSQDTLVSWAYVFVFLAVFFESLPIIGVIIPGGAIAVMAAGIFVRLGYFSLPIVIFISCVASIIIDNFGYAVGRRVKKKTFYSLAKRFFISERIIDRLCRLLHGHTAKAIIIGRLNPPSRSIAPFMAGMEKVPFLKFFCISVVSAVIWTAFYLLLGFLFGESIESVRSLDRAVLFCFIFVIVFVYILYLLRSYYVKRVGERRSC